MEIALAAIPILIALVIGFIKIRAAWNGSQANTQEISNEPELPSLKPDESAVMRELGLQSSSTPPSGSSGSGSTGQAPDGNRVDQSHGDATGK